jgi:tetrahydromethanopterin S-methyltransferase subunit F
MLINDLRGPLMQLEKLATLECSACKENYVDRNLRLFGPVSIRRLQSVMIGVVLAIAVLVIVELFR